jgi:hypothetical protein
MARTMPRLFRGGIGALCSLSMCAAHAAPYHPPEPAVNLGDTSFLDALGGPGFLVEEIGDGTHSDRAADGAGHTTPADITGVSGLTHVAWLSGSRMLGAWYGVEAVAVVADVNAGNQGSASGLGTVTVSPWILQWSGRRIGPVRVIQRAALDFDLPTGEYHRSSNVNLNTHAYTVHPYYAVTVFPTRHVETSWRVHYLWNGRNDSPPASTLAQSTQAGQAVHFNATAAYELSRGLWVGANGYFLRQVTDPAVNGASIQNSPEQVGAIGPGAVWNRGAFSLYANAYHEFGAENRPVGNKIVLRTEWVFAR